MRGKGLALTTLRAFSPAQYHYSMSSARPVLAERLVVYRLGSGVASVNPAL